MTDYIKSRQAAMVPGPIGITNRGMDNAITANDPPQLEITLEKINSTIMDYITNVIRPNVVEDEVNRSVPVQYAGSERWKTIRQDGFMRDDNGKILCPLIMIHRKSVKQGKLVNPVNKYLYTTVTQEYNSRNTYDRFAVQNNIKPSQQVRHIMIPDYVTLQYEVMMWTDYIVQMDRLIEQINVENEDYWGNRNDFKFRVKITEYPAEDTIEAEQDRLSRTTFSMEVSAYLLPESALSNMKKLATDRKLYTAKKVVSMVESVHNINDLSGK
jgi:hypothetical protein